MGENTAISWATHTFNAWIGCTKVSPACDFCYAETMSKFRGWAEWGPGKPRKKTSVANWRKPLQWNKAAAARGVKETVFCNSLADWADTEVTHDWRMDLAGVTRETPNLEWLLLTKRHATAQVMLEAANFPKENVRVGFTVEDAKMASVRLPKLRELARAGWRTFVSYEPALGLVDWEPYTSDGTIGWLISGAESGSHARPANPDWFRAARDACQRSGIPYHHKQNGEWVDKNHAGADEWRRTKERQGVIYGQLRRDGLLIFDGREFVTQYPFPVRSDAGYYPGPCMVRIGVKHSGAMLDGREHRAVPR